MSSDPFDWRLRPMVREEAAVALWTLAQAVPFADVGPEGRVPNA